MKILPLLAVAAAVGLWAGCTSVSSDDITGVDYGPYPADYQALVIREAQAHAYTPAGATFVFGKPIPGLNQGIFVGTGTAYGYLVPVEIIRPGGSEAHTPVRLHYFFIANGRVTEVTDHFVVGRARYTGEMTD